MQIPSIRGYFNSTATDILESSWKGRVIQVLCVISFLALIYYIAFRHKKTDATSSQDCPHLEDRASQKLEPSVEQEDRPTTEARAIPIEATLPDSRKNGFEIRVVTFNAWLSEKTEACNRIDDFQAEILELKAQLKIMIPIFQAHPEFQIDWDAFIKECDAVAEAGSWKRCTRFRSCLVKLRSWSTTLRRQLTREDMKESNFWDLYHFRRLLGVSIVTCNRITGANKRAINPALEVLDRLTDKKKRSLFKPTLYKNALRVFIQELKHQVEKMTPVFQSCHRDRKGLCLFFERCSTVIDSKVSKRICSYLKQSLVFLEDRSTTLLSRYEITKCSQDSDFTKAFLKYFSVWLPKKIESCDYLIPLASERDLQSVVCSKALKTVVSELKEQVEKMVLVFQTYSEIKTDELTAFCAVCDRLETEERPVYDRCLALRGGLEKLQSWSGCLENAV